MYVVVVDIQIKPAHREEFLAAMLANASASLREEPGCDRFDVVQDEVDPNHLILYEIYRDKAAFEQDHLKRPHFLEWRDAVKEWHERPAKAFKGVPLNEA
jgi:(4S)-4-hydroxy-5-phosphonooxypentane-2,3-dione isomerase